MNSILPSFRYLPSTPTSITTTTGSRPPPSKANAPTESYIVFDPTSDIVSSWNHVFLIICIMALFIDPLYFFLPYVGGPACLASDASMGVFITVLRTMADLLYLMNMLMKFRTGFIAPNSRVFGKGELVMDAREIALRYLKKDFVIDLAATLPLPQFVIWVLIPTTRNSRADHANSTIALIVLLQYVPRLFIIFPLNNKIIKTNGILAKTAWAGAAYNLLLYLLASHVLGAVWYLCSIARQFSCWKHECARENHMRTLACIPSFLDCNSLRTPEREYWANVTTVLVNCDASNEQVDFKFGMFAAALSSEVASENFVVKYLFCFWWGLRNLSSYGQNLVTSIYMWENIFAISICLFGMVLFALLIGNMQTSLQSITVRIEEWRLKRKDTEEWMRHRQLPEDLQQRVRRFVQYKWLATRGVDEEFILQSLPLDLRREIQRHLCLSLVRRVPFFAQMDDQLLDAMCERLVSSLSTEGNYIVREGEPVNEMLFIIRGQLESSTTGGGRSGFFNSITLRPGDFCGEELLTWALMPNSTLNLPLSTRTVRAVSEVEAFALQADDLQFFAHQFKRLQSKKLQHAFRYYSHQWRTWGACFIEAAWRRFKKRKMAKELTERENSFYYRTLGDQDGNSYNTNKVEEGLLDHEGIDSAEGTSSMENQQNHEQLGTTILARRFAKNTKKESKLTLTDPSAEGLKMPKLVKPDEPDFSVDRPILMKEKENS
ncbi:CYCLIC NUCLEOTIDE-GATED CHANNEL 18, cyclic nucleotide-gated channel 18 [Hibiscus trionum]|uniref:CYCLIC NUCLEOTIDE-GATED CHANNEL 18, cyclic nucleotide-gated channel 18 n=1 Tax=Hibiscus trionum TaxID=183268 RepID=A0A9W7J7H0_HIBTR|nr:CYCLIC NUCLEOTIDE-GATED CHANNEL 18, cyclic nucleotide-gated channel 18 [Hibiscus trionum]